MKFLIVIVFAGIVDGGYQDLYIFQDPSYSSRVECRQDIGTEFRRTSITAHLTQVYKTYKSIDRIICAEEKVIKEVLAESKGEYNT